jgi:Protein of unknown function with HXXEE motif
VQSANSGYGVPWLLLCGAFALHVIDEALTDFLSVYNPTVRAIRARFPFVPLPTFTFRVWLSGLIAAIVLLLLLTPAAFGGASELRPWAYLFGIVMVGNGVLHMIGSVYRRKAMPGVYTAPLILAAGVYLLTSVR